MKWVLTIVLYYTMVMFCSAQTFTVPLFISDNAGNTDTVYLGGAITALDTVVDSALGESNIIDVPYDSVFDCRLADYWSGPLHIVAKKLIKHYDCSNSRYIQYLLLIDCNAFPVTIRWQHNIIDSSGYCISASLMSNHIGFQVENVTPVQMINQDSVIYNQSDLDAPYKGSLYSGDSVLLYGVEFDIGENIIIHRNF